MNLFRKLAALALSLTLISVASVGCSKKAAVQEDDSAIPSAANADENSAALGSGDSDSGQAQGLQTVNFPYDSFTFDSTAAAILKGNAAILKDKKSLNIQVEGHCDQRGGIQYNLALGEKRANAVRKYLVDLGIAKSRITTISFGKERLLATGSSEEDNARNRRANFVITSK